MMALTCVEITNSKLIKYLLNEFNVKYEEDNYNTYNKEDKFFDIKNINDCNKIYQISSFKGLSRNDIYEQYGIYIMDKYYGKRIKTGIGRRGTCVYDNDTISISIYNDNMFKINKKGKSYRYYIGDIITEDEFKLIKDMFKEAGDNLNTITNNMKQTIWDNESSKFYEMMKNSNVGESNFFDEYIASLLEKYCVTRGLFLSVMGDIIFNYSDNSFSTMHPCLNTYSNIKTTVTDSVARLFTLKV